ncbi:DICT sensory domain-containing protein [Halalkalicoccus subterraneus]|uniref:DICT sensory domain-containing protein n=1 Tax=Halalkalicoccus subterraneus TaxID=2675002 RepID=UPI000EFB4241|nr:DICT sensory domain-containing protein [Halalkalicoccus subterraneus]
MSLSELISGVEAHEMTLTVYNADGAVEDLRERFADRNLTVEAGAADSGPDRFVTLDSDGTFVSATGLDDLLKEPSERTNFENDPYRPILDHLDETMFTSYSRRKMLAASREIEDRAWRVGKGQLHAGFQRISVLESQLETYSALGSRDALTVHTYGTPDIEIPTQTDFLIHAEGAEEIATSWFVAFDGADIDEMKCALLAEERDPGEFYGFWTYDPSTIDYIVSHLTSTYVPVDADGSGGESRFRPGR